MGIIETPEVIQSKILNAILKKISGKKTLLLEKSDRLKVEISDVVQRAILNSDTFNSISTDVLKRDFGLTDDVVLIFRNNLADLFSIEVDTTPSKDVPNSIYKISVHVKEREEGDPVIDGLINKTSYVSKRSGEIIRWLEWLLFYGEKFINKQWKVYPKEGKGRSLMAVMITGRSDFKFKISKKYEGRYGNNFVSKALESSQEEIQSIIKRYINEST